MQCSSGENRSGIVSALVLALVGVGGQDIVADYALTERATPWLISD